MEEGKGWGQLSALSQSVDAERGSISAIHFRVLRATLCSSLHHTVGGGGVGERERGGKENKGHRGRGRGKRPKERKRVRGEKGYKKRGR